MKGQSTGPIQDIFAHLQIHEVRNLQQKQFRQNKKRGTGKKLVSLIHNITHFKNRMGNKLKIRQNHNPLLWRRS